MVDHVDWEYRRTLEIGADELDDARLVLRFNGLDTVAEVRVDDDVVAQVDNMFVPVEVELSGRVGPGEHTLSVRFASAERVGAERLAAHPPAVGLSPRTMVRKSQYMYGWDWGPCLRGCGIWLDVSLVRAPAARLDGWAYDAAFTGDDCRVTVDVAA